MKLTKTKVLLSLIMAGILSFNKPIKLSSDDILPKTEPSIEIENDLVANYPKEELEKPSIVEEEPTLQPDINNIEEIDKSEIIENYLAYFNSIVLNYKVADYLMDKSQIDKIGADAQIQTNCHVTTDYNIDNLIMQIATNSEAMLASHSEYTSAFINDKDSLEINEDQINFSIILSDILQKYLQNASNNRQEDWHNFSQLSIVFGDADNINEEEVEPLKYEDGDDSMTLGYYDTDLHLIVLDMENIHFAATNYYNDSFVQVFYNTLNHELNHVRQQVCACREEAGSPFLGLNYNQDFIPTIGESSSESELYNLDYDPFAALKTTDYYTYDVERTDESLLFLLSLFTSQDINEYYNAIFDTNFKALHAFFNIKDKEDLYRFYRIMYVIDGKNYRNNLALDILEDANISDDELIDCSYLIGYDYRLDIFIQFIKNLIAYMQNNELSLSDNLAIYHFAKEQIIQNTYSRDNDTYERLYDDNFTKQIVELDNQYMKFLSEYYQEDEMHVRFLEQEDATYCAKTIVSLAQESFPAYLEYAKQARELCERFPLLKCIGYVAKEDISFMDYMDENGIAYRLKVVG